MKTPPNPDVVLTMTTKPAGTFILQAKRESDIPTSLLAARGTVEVLRNKMFDVLLMILTKSSISEPKHTRPASPAECHTVIIITSDDINTQQSNTEVEFTNDSPIYKEKVTREYLGQQQGAIVQHTSETVRTDRKDSLNIVDIYDPFQPKVEEVMTKYVDMQDEHSGRPSVAKQPIESTPSNSRLFHPAAFPAGPCQRALKRNRFDTLVMEGCAERATSEKASLVISAFKMYRSLRLCVRCRRLNAITVTVRYRYPIPRMHKYKDLLGTI